MLSVLPSNLLVAPHSVSALDDHDGKASAWDVVDVDKENAAPSRVGVNVIPDMFAQGKSTEKSNHIDITNEKGRRSQAQINRVVHEAEKFKAEDESDKQNIEAKNGMENVCPTMCNVLQEEMLKGKIEGDTKDNIDKTVQQTLDWFDQNRFAEKGEFETKWKELDDGVAADRGCFTSSPQQIAALLGNLPTAI